MAKAKMFKGNHPDEKGRLVAIAPTLERWHLYYMGSNEHGRKFKLVAADRAAHKANYWLAWSRKGKGFLTAGIFKDGALLGYHHSRVFIWAGHIAARLRDYKMDDPNYVPERAGKWAWAKVVGEAPDDISDLLE